MFAFQLDERQVVWLTCIHTVLHSLGSCVWVQLSTGQEYTKANVYFPCHFPNMHYKTFYIIYIGLVVK